MGMGRAIASAFRNYFRLRGRASRSEYWYWVLFSTLVNIAFALIPALLRPLGGGQPSGGAAVLVLAFALLQILCSLGFIIPGVTVTVRRLHDTDHSGWWYFLPFTLIGAIPFLIWMCRRGSPGANRFGVGTQADIADVFGSGNTSATLRDQRV